MSNQAQPPYDKKDSRSIERFAKRLEGTSLRQLHGDALRGFRVRGKGGLGAMVERHHFGYEPNSQARPDFPEAGDSGVELKTSPVRRLRNGRKSIKERLVLNIINYKEVAEEVEFERSTFWKKNALLLLMFYLWEAGVEKEDFVFELASLWGYPEEDLRIIKEDWQKIVATIRTHKAEKLSERDTLYLAACTKGKDSTETRAQRKGKNAKQRAFSLKRSYVDSVFARLSGKAPIATTKIRTDTIQRKGSETFEQAVVRHMSGFAGLGEPEIKALLKVKYKAAAKNKLNLLAKAMLGARSEEIEEFLKANVQMKTIRLNSDGSLNEHMSFRQIPYDDIVTQTWEQSTFYEELNRRLFFVVFKKDAAGTPRFVNSFFYGMSERDFSEAKKVWSMTKRLLLARKSPYLFPAAEDSKVAHVRPKARRATDRYKTAWGHRIRKMAFWLNKEFILAVLRRNCSR